MRTLQGNGGSLIFLDYFALLFSGQVLLHAYVFIIFQ